MGASLEFISTLGGATLLLGLAEGLGLWQLSGAGVAGLALQWVKNLELYSSVEDHLPYAGLGRKSCLQVPTWNLGSWGLIKILLPQKPLKATRACWHWDVMGAWACWSSLGAWCFMGCWVQGYLGCWS